MCIPLIIVVFRRITACLDYIMLHIEEAGKWKIVVYEIQGFRVLTYILSAFTITKQF